MMGRCCNRKSVMPVEAPKITAEVIPSEKRKKKAVLSLCTPLLPEEIMLEVLLRLPVKSILRFGAVCRSWAALLSSKDFCSLYMAVSKARTPAPKLLSVSPTARLNSSAMYSCSASGSRDDLLFTFDCARHNCVEIVTPSPCYGLTLVYDAAAATYYVCNASTRAIKRLPPHRTPNDFPTAGLGFGARTSEYKVVRLINGISFEKHMNKCEVYTPGAGCWRLAAGGGIPFRLFTYATSAALHSVTYKVPPVFANGFLHWIVNPSLMGRRPRAAIITFSLADENLGCVRSPPFWTSEVHLHSMSQGEHLAVMDDQLCMVRDLRNTIPQGALEIWKLLDYSPGEWSLYHRIDLLGHVGIYLLDPIVVRVIGVIDSCSSGKKIVIASNKHKGRKQFEQMLHTYDPRCQALETILSITETHTSHLYAWPGSGFSLFEESLVPVHKPMDS